MDEQLAQRVGVACLVTGYELCLDPAPLFDHLHAPASSGQRLRADLPKSNPGPTLGLFLKNAVYRRRVRAVLVSTGERTIP